MAYEQDTRFREGSTRLLRDIAAIGLVTDLERVPARQRLDEKLGARLARALCQSLAIDAPPPSAGLELELRSVQAA